MSARSATSSALGRVASSEKPRMKSAIAAIGSARSATVVVGEIVVMSLCRCRELGRRAGRLSLAPARDHVGFVVEPERAVLAQHLARRFEIASVGDHVGEAM